LIKKEEERGRSSSVWRNTKIREMIPGERFIKRDNIWWIGW